MLISLLAGPVTRWSVAHWGALGVCGPVVGARWARWACQVFGPSKDTSRHPIGPVIAQTYSKHRLPRFTPIEVRPHRFP